MMASLPHGEYVRGPNQQPRRVCVLPAPVTPGVENPAPWRNCRFTSRLNRDSEDLS